MGGLTPNRLYPYPASAEEGRGGLHVQKLADVVDQDLRDVYDSYINLAARPSGSFRPTADITGIPNGVFFPISTNTTEYTRNGFVRPGSALFKEPLWGWYMIDYHVAMLTSGTINAASIRESLARYMGPTTGGLVQLNQFECIDNQSDGTAYLHSTFVVQLTVQNDMIYQVFHQNTSSTITVVAADTHVEYTRLCPMV
jgi:hypothetical protein